MYLIAYCLLQYKTIRDSMFFVNLFVRDSIVFVNLFVTHYGLKESCECFFFQASPLECEICKLLVTELDNLLKENRSQEVVIETVHKLCNALPDAFKKFVSV